LGQDETTIEKSIEGAQAALAADQARMAQAQKDADSQVKLTETSIAQARARVAAQEQALALVVAGPRRQDVEKARAAAAEARVAEANAKKDFDRQQKLVEKGFVSKQALDTAETTYESAKNARIAAGKSLEMAEEGSRPEEIAQSRAQLDEARAALKNAEAQQVQVELKRESAHAAEAQVRQAQAALDSAVAGRGQRTVRRNQLKAAQTSAQDARAKLAKAQNDPLQDASKAAAAQAQAAARVRAGAALEDARYMLKIVAPIDGVIISQPWEVGMLLPPGFSAVSSGVSITESVPPIVIANNSRMYVYADVDESDVAGVHEGMPVEVVVDALPDRPFQGVVHKIIPQGVENQSVVTFQVRVLVKGDIAPLKAGMTADITVKTAHADNVIGVPNEALSSDEQGKYVMLPAAKPGGQPTQRRVTTGLTDFTVTEVKSGLQEGEKVLLAAPRVPQGGKPGQPGGPAPRDRMMMQMRGRVGGGGGR
jgi:HlyD family secretion protein